MLNLLVADDNRISLDFFAAALHQLGHDCVAVDDGLAAVESASAVAFDLLLLDACMPVMDGCTALARIRNGNGLSRAAVALATTADTTRERHDALIDAGFAAVLAKPTRLVELEAALRRHAPSDDAFDDARALAAVGGNAQIVTALRGLLLAELDRLPGELELASRQPEAVSLLAERMHRLQASAGFCGVTGLERAARELEQQAQRETVWPRQHVAILLRRCDCVAVQLRAHSGD